MDSYQAAHDHFVSAVRQTEPLTPVGEEAGQDARDKRRQFSFFIGSELIRLASTIPGAGTDVGNAAELAISTVINMAGELIFGAQVLIENELYYAEASGHREIIEVTNLLRYFSLELERAERWQKCTDKDFKAGKSEFKPVLIRRSLGDSSNHYDVHCSLGGHPRPTGRILLTNHVLHDKWIESFSPVVNRGVRYKVVDSVQCDLLLHARHAWHAASAAVAALDSVEESAELLQDLIMSTEVWVHTDALAVVRSSSA